MFLHLGSINECFYHDSVSSNFCFHIFATDTQIVHQICKFVVMLIDYTSKTTKRYMAL